MKLLDDATVNMRPCSFPIVPDDSFAICSACEPTIRSGEYVRSSAKLGGTSSSSFRYPDQPSSNSLWIPDRMYSRNSWTFRLSWKIRECPFRLTYAVPARRHPVCLSPEKAPRLFLIGDLIDEPHDDRALRAQVCAYSGDYWRVRYHEENDWAELAGEEFQHFVNNPA